MRKTILLLIAIIMISCGEATTPKPKAYLSLEYPELGYNRLGIKKPYNFDVAKNTKIKYLPQSWLKIQYPKLKASVDITYRPINDNLKELFVEAEKLVIEHTVKADHISWRDFSNKENKVYGKMCEIAGNAASQIQFHVTDSTKHFIKGSLFFYVKPNYDSILPAVAHIKKDMIRMMESLQWEN
ncbi:gliding motility lipoprotein GldD [Tenacibaculum sp. nBUS_03]|uniref:gliding motility lipoprotein GldD n=1 Tax=Tenacibaculum sp. nBUS_03 TaxID=3395320 RepID=UPI003EBCD76E